MKVGLLQFEIHIDHATSLKDKRRVVKSVKDRLHREHMVSVAEVGDLEIWNRAQLGVAAVSADGAYLHSVLETVLRKLTVLPEGRLGACISEVVDASLLWDDRGEDGRPLWTEEERRGDSDEVADRGTGQGSGRERDRGDA